MIVLWAPSTPLTPGDLRGPQGRRLFEQAAGLDERCRRSKRDLSASASAVTELWFAAYVPVALARCTPGRMGPDGGIAAERSSWRHRCFHPDGRWRGRLSRVRDVMGMAQHQ